MCRNLAVDVTGAAGLGGILVGARGGNGGEGDVRGQVASSVVCRSGLGDAMSGPRPGEPHLVALAHLQIATLVRTALGQSGNRGLECPIDRYSDGRCCFG